MNQIAWLSFRIMFVSLALLSVTGLHAQAPDVEIVRDRGEPYEELVKKANALRKAGELLSVDQVNAQLSREFCSLDLPKPSSKQLSDREIWKLARTAHVRVGWHYLCKNCNNWHQNLAGGYFITADGAIATCHHVVKPQEDMREGYLVAAAEDGTLYPVAEVLAASDETDSAIIRVNLKEPVKPLALNTHVYPGDAAWCFSDPLERSSYFSKGMVNRFYMQQREGGAESARMEVSTDWAPGSSGAAVIDEFGNAMGHVSEISTDGHQSGDGKKRRGRTTPLIVFHCASRAADVIALAGGSEKPAVEEASAEPSETVESLREKGAFGFPSESSQTLCDTDELRVQAWSDLENLVIQIILWNDGNDELGETRDGREMGDGSDLVLDLDFNRKRTPEVDRNYMLNPWPVMPGLHYTIPFAGASSSSIKRDSKGRGSVRYLPVSDDRKVRVDTYAIPFSELGIESGDTIGVGAMADSMAPKLIENSVGFNREGIYYGRDLPYKKFSELILNPGEGSFDIDGIPRGRDERKKIEKPKKELLKIGARPPEPNAKGWLNVAEPLTLAKLKGKVVLIDFWATWCGPCVAGMPHLNELHETYSKDGLVIMGITDQSKTGIERFLKGKNISYPIGTGSKVSGEYGVTGIPHAFLIGRDGKLAWEGHPNDEDFETAIKDALAVPVTDEKPVEDSAKHRTLEPGETFFLEFPELGNTWRDKPVRAGVYLPDDYTADRNFPLFVWYSGGAGSDNPKKPIQIVESKSFICVAVPYRSEDGGQDGGWQTPWIFYKTIFDRLESSVPNIDPDRRVCGGFSSGGAAIMYQIGNSKGAFQDYFHAFMPGGAGWPMGGLASIKGRPMLALMGEKDKRLPNYRKLHEQALAAGIDVRLFLLEGAGHGMSPDYDPVIREWLKDRVIQRGAGEP